MITYINTYLIAGRVSFVKVKLMWVEGNTATIESLVNGRVRQVPRSQLITHKQHKYILDVREMEDRKDSMHRELKEQTRKEFMR